MRTIWKYQVAVDDRIELTAPAPAIVMHIEASPDIGTDLTFWVMVDTEGQPTTRRYGVAGTGHPLLDWMQSYTHEATVLGGPFVWHVFAEVDGE